MFLEWTSSHITYLWLNHPHRIWSFGFGSCVFICRKHWDLFFRVIERHESPGMVKGLANGLVAILVLKVPLMQHSWYFWWGSIQEEFITVFDWFHHLSGCRIHGHEKQNDKSQWTATSHWCHHHRLQICRAGKQWTWWVDVPLTAKYYLNQINLEVKCNS